MEKPRDEPEQILMDAIGFGEEELEANREAKLSQRQRDYLSMKRNTWLLGIILLAFVWVVEWLGTDNTTLHVVTTISVLYVCYNWWSLQRDLANQVVSLEGHVSLKISGRSFQVTVQKQTFNIKKHELMAFIDGESYTIYYAPHSKTILSVKWLRE